MQDVLGIKAQAHNKRSFTAPERRQDSVGSFVLACHTIVQTIVKKNNKIKKSLLWGFIGLKHPINL